MIQVLVAPSPLFIPTQYVGFWLAYLLPTIVFVTAPLVLLLGRNVYIRSPPQGSVLAAAVRVYRTAAKGRKAWTWNPITTWSRHKAADFWEYAKPSRYLKEEREGAGTEGKPKWMTWDDQWVEEVRRGVREVGLIAGARLKALGITEDETQDI